MNKKQKNHYDNIATVFLDDQNDVWIKTPKYENRFGTYFDFVSEFKTDSGGSISIVGRYELKDKWPDDFYFLGVF
jgi:hypothetical protein